MAVYAAHITRTLQGTPSVFQVAAQEALGATVKPALRKLIEYLAAVYPNKCSWCERWYDELYLLFDACLQYHYLKHYAASFSESFYGLLRVPLSTSSEFSSGQRLPELIERGSLLLLVMVPYLRDKVEQVIDRWRDDKEDGKLGKSSADRLRLAAIRVHTVCAVVYQCVRLATLARYVARAGRSPGPGLALLGLALRDAPPREDADSWLDLGKSLRNGQFGAALTFPALGGALLQGAQYGAFAVQALRGWRARASSDHAALPAPPPPHRDEKALRWKNKCPLCLRTWKIPTVLPVSGYIFCYPCISRELRARTRCPVSGAPAAPADLVRLYIE